MMNKVYRYDIYKYYVRTISLKGYAFQLKLSIVSADINIIKQISLTQTKVKEKERKGGKLD